MIRRHKHGCDDCNDAAFEGDVLGIILDSKTGLLGRLSRRRMDQRFRGDIGVPIRTSSCRPRYNRTRAFDELAVIFPSREHKYEGDQNVSHS
jgi:hypothetical protein